MQLNTDDHESMDPNDLLTKREMDLTSAGRFDSASLADVIEERRRDMGASHSTDDVINIPSPIPEVDEVFHEGEKELEHRVCCNNMFEL